MNIKLVVLELKVLISWDMGICIIISSADEAWPSVLEPVFLGPVWMYGLPSVITVFGVTIISSLSSMATSRADVATTLFWRAFIHVMRGALVSWRRVAFYIYNIRLKTCTEMILSLCMEFSLNSREGMWVLYNCTILFLTKTQRWRSNILKHSVQVEQPL